MRVDRRSPRRRQVRPVEPRLAVDVRRDERLADERPVGSRGHRNVARPTCSSTRIAFAVVFSSVWLPATVVTPRARARGWRAPAGARSRRRGRDRSRGRSASGSAAESRPPRPRRSEGCAPRAGGERAGLAGTRQRFLTRPPLEQRDDEAGGERVAGAVPSTASTRGGAARATSSPCSSSTAPSAPRVSAISRGGAGQRLELVPVHDHEVGAAGARAAPAGRAPRSGRRSRALAPPRATVSSGISSWQSTAVRPPSLASPRPTARSRRARPRSRSRRRRPRR